jgi:ParB family chromosome partitioning protein
MVESLREDGQLQPVRVRWDQGLGKYMLIMGERRFRAAGPAGLTALAAVVHDGPLTAAEVLEVQLIENTVRENLSPIELATTIRRLIDEFKYTQETVAAKLKMTQSAVSQSLSLLNLEPTIRAKVDGGAIPARTAVHIAKAGSPEAQREVAAKVEAEKLTESQTAEVVKKKRAAAKAPGKGRGGKSPAPKVLEKDRPYNDSGYRFRVENRKGIRPPELHAALLRWASAVEGELEPAPASA